MSEKINTSELELAAMDLKAARDMNSQRWIMDTLVSVAESRQGFVDMPLWHFTTTGELFDSRTGWGQLNTEMQEMDELDNLAGSYVLNRTSGTEGMLTLGKIIRDKAYYQLAQRSDIREKHVAGEAGVIVGLRTEVGWIKTANGINPSLDMYENPVVTSESKLIPLLSRVIQLDQRGTARTRRNLADTIIGEDLIKEWQKSNPEFDERVNRLWSVMHKEVGRSLYKEVGRSLLWAIAMDTPPKLSVISSDRELVKRVLP